MPRREETTYFSVRNLPKRLLTRLRVLAVREEERRGGKRCTIQEMHTRALALGVAAIEREGGER